MNILIAAVQETLLD